MFKVDFVGIGSGKCGSTWFFENLVKHPEVCKANPKELNFFSDLYERGIEWYASNFSGCEAGFKRGEFSVTYMYNPAAAERIYQHNPDAKIIAIVRDPIGRTYSDYWHFIRKGDIPASMAFEEYIQDERRLVFGDYATYLAPFFSRFPPENIMIIVLEDFNLNHARGFSRVFEFLGLKNTSFIPDDVSKMVNVGRNYRFLALEKIMVRTYRFLARGGRTRLAETIKRTGIPEVLRRLNMRSSALPPMPESSRAALRQYFDPRKAALADLIGQKLTAWH